MRVVHYSAQELRTYRKGSYVRWKLFDTKRDAELFALAERKRHPRTKKLTGEIKRVAIYISVTRAY